MNTRKRHSFVSLMKQTEVTACIRTGKLICIYNAVAVGTEIIICLFACGVAEILIKTCSGL
jgi:hypothetical protein